MFLAIWRMVQYLVVWAHIFVVVHARCYLLPIGIYFLIFGNLSRLIILAYLIYMIYDLQSSTNGGKRWNWLRKSEYFHRFRDYFPIELIQTAELPKNHNYLGIYHPHGILFLANSAFAADAFDLEQKTGLNVFSTTLNINFATPIIREYFLAMGYISVDEGSLKHVLGDPVGGNLVVVLTGGAAEAGLSEPGEYRIILRRRRGFCRVAIQTGSHLVPILVFGEVDCFDILIKDPEGLLKKFKQVFQEWTGINLLLYGNKESSWPYLAMPRRSPITIITGAPIPVVKKDSPTMEDIISLQQLYIDNLQNLFEQHKHKYLKDPSIKLIVE